MRSQEIGLLGMRGVNGFIIIDFISNTLIVLTSTRQEGS